jgi:hypothetical protein
MLEGMIILASYGSYGGEIGTLLNDLASMGFFSYVLPFLLIFAVLFGILEKIQIFKEAKAVNGIIAFVVGLMALQFNFVSVFFAEIFPRLGVGLAVILVAIVLLGLFAPTNKGWTTYVFFAIGVIILGVILFNSAGAVGWSSGYWWQENWSKLAIVAAFLAVIGVIVGGSAKDPEAQSIMSELLKKVSK